MRVALGALFAVSACATAPAPINPASLQASNPMPPLHVGADGEVLGLAFSGGGARAAAFSLGVLQELRATPAADGRPLSDHIAWLSAVSGGSIMAAYFGQHGSDGLDSFRAAYLDKDWAAQLHISAASPANWLRAWRGGMNDETRLADWLDREVFEGAIMAELWRADGTQVWLNAADLYNGVAFAFAPLTFDALCADLAPVRIADAVAASMAVPVIFEPVLVEPRRDQCAPEPAWVARALSDRSASSALHAAARSLQSYRDPAQLSFVHLVDGGLIDNLGLSSLSLMRLTADAPYAPFSAEGALRLRRLTFLVVNAENIRVSDWQMRAEGPTGGQMLDTSYDVTVEAANRASFDTFRAAMDLWERDLVAYRCGLPAESVASFGADWRCADVDIIVDMISFADLDGAQRARLGPIPTRVSLPAEDIDVLIAGGRAALLTNQAAQALRRAP